MWKFLKIYYSDFKFLRQKPLDHFIPVFYCVNKKLIIEIDGEIHNQQKGKDNERDNLFLQKYAIKTIRFTNNQVFTDLEYLRKILDEVLH